VCYSLGVHEKLIRDVDLGVLFGVGNDCIEARDGDLLSDYIGEESEFDAENWRNRDTICSFGGAGYMLRSTESREQLSAVRISSGEKSGRLDEIMQYHVFIPWLSNNSAIRQKDFLLPTGQNHALTPLR